jgi:hypothetical protein
VEIEISLYSLTPRLDVARRVAFNKAFSVDKVDPRFQDYHTNFLVCAIYTANANIDGFKPLADNATFEELNAAFEWFLDLDLDLITAWARAVIDHLNKKKSQLGSFKVTS